ncbi:MAG: glycosyltransferase [Ktedonobacterales bacterium]
MPNVYLLSASAWQHVLLSVVWWGCAVLVMRALALALMGRQRASGWLTLWMAPFVVFNLITPSLVALLLGMPLRLAVSLLVALVLLDGLSAVTHRDWNAIGAQSYIAVPVVALSFFAYALAVTLTTPMNWLGYTLSAFLLAGELASAAIDLYYTGELLEVLCRRVWRGRLGPWVAPVATWPRVSLHVAAHNEAPEMVMATLHALAQLDYPDYEVILIDDNSSDAAIWRPVMEFCRGHGFKVFHLMQYPGYKAGALNFALQQTDPSAELIAVVDADYIVKPNWLRETAPYFLSDPQLAFLQTPQAFTYPRDDWYHRANALSEDYFFSIGMPARAERNTLIFCGTMGMIRRRVLERVGGWAEWCITEDAELSLRMLSRGYHGAYVQTVYGHGTLPPTLADLKRQHFRWAFGSIQLTRSYLGLLLLGIGRRQADPRQQATLGRRPKLTVKQRYDYVMHGAHWYHACLQITLGLLLTGIALIRVLNIPFTLRPLVASALLLPVLGVVIGVARVLWSSRVALRCSRRDAWGVLFGLLAVHWAVTRACIAGLYRRHLPFLRTPRSGAYVTFSYALRSTLVESALAVLAIATVGALLWREVSAETLALSFMLLWHACVMSTAPILALTQAAYDRKRRRSAQAAHTAAAAQPTVMTTAVGRH